MEAERLDALEQGRRATAEGAWATADEALTLADRQGLLEAEDLERLATTAYMLGRVEDYLGALARAYDAHLERGDELRAAGCALWIGITLGMSGKVGRAGGWLGRAERLIEPRGPDCVEAVYLRVPAMFERMASGDLAGSIAIAAEIADAARRFGDHDLLALAAHEHGHLLVLDGRYEEGMRLFDEAMVTVTAGETSPIPTGIVYCGVITGCQDAFELRRAAEWTSELSQWCERQPDMVAFSGRCLVHRAEVLQVRGAWSQAMDAAERGYARCVAAENLAAAAEAAYRQAELHRVRGELAEAETAYRLASRDGREPQPGLALLWLARGEGADAATTLRRVLAEATDRAARVRVLPAVVAAMLAVGDLAAAREACRELADAAAGSEVLTASAEACAGEVALAEGDAHAALPALRRAAAGWQQLDAPYEGACVRVLVGRACRMLGDEQSARLEFEAARDVFARLGARPDVVRADMLLGDAAEDLHGLTARELEVLRLVASGGTNKAIATELVLSERTVDRHVSNILAKLRVPSRAAATAFAYEHRLI